MIFNGTKTSQWKFFVPILQAIEYLSWWRYKGELLIRKALGKHEILKFFKRYLNFHKFLLMDLQPWYWTPFSRISWRFEAFDSEKNAINVDFTKSIHLMNHLYDVISYDIKLAVKLEQRIFMEWFWYRWILFFEYFWLVKK